jgi:HK97 gp10 family phage protein
MASRTLTVEGLNETVRTLKKLGVDVSDLKDAFSRIGTRAAGQVRSAAPVRTGALAASVKPSKRQNSVYIYAGGARAFYAPFVEFGTRYQSAQRFMRDTARMEGPRALDDLERELTQIINRLGLAR